MMTKEQIIFAKHYVMSQLPNIEDDHDAVIKTTVLIEHLLLNNWFIDEIIEYCKCLEHVDPDLPEEIALDIMKSIKRSVERRLYELNLVQDTNICDRI
jgi:hypothetical protein